MTAQNHGVTCAARESMHASERSLLTTADLSRDARAVGSSGEAAAADAASSQPVAPMPPIPPVFGIVLEPGQLVETALAPSGRRNGSPSWARIRLYSHSTCCILIVSDGFPRDTSRIHQDTLGYIRILYS